VINTWQSHELQEVADVIDCKHRTPSYASHGIPIISPGNIAWGPLSFDNCKRIPYEEYLDLMDHCNVENGDIVLSRNQSFGIASYVNEEAPFALGQDTVLIKPQKCNARYLYYYVQSKGLQAQIAKLSGGSTFKRINLKDIRKLTIVVPPLPEQRKIAEILSTWDEAIDLTEQLIAAKERRKQALMQRLLAGQVRFPGFEDEWEMVTLDNVTSKVGSGITPRGGSESYLASGIPLIRSQNVLTGRLNLEDVAFISEEQHNKMSATRLKAKDVLLNITGASIGRSCVVPVNFIEGNVNQHVCIIRPTDQLNSTFLSAFLNSAIGQRQIDAFQAGGNRQGLNYVQIRSFKLPLPTIEEQEKVAQILQTCDQELALHQQKLAALRRQKQGLMQQLLTGRVRVVG